ncbi:unnamed protein product [Meganyctiphanes norvegica]|uniref:aralkylamine N-acetyltransferase n=1 Tax=Meganyctiphanes norvegica TaxID=48144 RepID=A0AAV2RGN9_MEGNR
MTESMQSDISICSLKEDTDLPEVSRLFKDAFLTNEPTCRALHVVPEEVMDWYTVVIKACLSSGLSLGARDTSSNALVAMMLNKVLTPKQNSTFGNPVGKTTNKQILILSEIFEEVENTVDIFTKYNVERVLELGILTVDPKYSGKGLGKRLVEKSEELALNNGCQLANVQASNIATQSIFKKRNYETYLTYSMEGKPQFDLKAAGDTTCWLMMAKPLVELPQG